MRVPAFAERIRPLPQALPGRSPSPGRRREVIRVQPFQHRADVGVNEAAFQVGCRLLAHRFCVVVDGRRRRTRLVAFVRQPRLALAATRRGGLGAAAAAIRILHGQPKKKYAANNTMAGTPRIQPMTYLPMMYSLWMDRARRL
ncbi:MAG TPA: hypothetical protein VIW70_07960 [Rubrivivax sp.]